ncbi:MAG: 2-dehydropantoate 2-reductase [Pseudomonadota bacterium]
MKVCIVGAGSIGGFLGTLIAARCDVQVSAFARGATLVALNEHGWRLRMGDELLQAPAIASNSAKALGIQNVVFIAVKGPAMPEISKAIVPLIGDDTIVVPAMNGVPWWFMDGQGEAGLKPLESVDPGGQIASNIPTQQVLGAVVHASASRPEPGMVDHKMGKGLIIGEQSGSQSERVDSLAGLLKTAGFNAVKSYNVRRDIWYKLWGNMTMNPVSAICGATADRVLADPEVRGFCTQVMREAQAIGERIGCPIEEEPEDRHAVTAKLGAFKTSMLQDAEAGREIELDSIVGAVHEIGQRLGVPVPYTSTLLGLTRLFGRSHGLYPVN